jgi:hypothetical protein
MGWPKPVGVAHWTRNRACHAGLALLLVCACSGRKAARQGEPRPPRDSPDRPTGCIDTPHIGGDHRATTTGIRCGARPHTGDTVLLHGRVTMQVESGLPGPGVEGMWVGAHPLGRGPVQLDALPRARAETTTGPQGAFRLSFAGAGEYLITVRANSTGPVLAAQRIVAQSGDPSPPLQLQIPRNEDR